MRSFLAGLRQLVLPWGASVGRARLVLGPDLPPALAAYRFEGVARYDSAIIFYNGSANDDTYLYIAEVPQQTSAPGGYEIHIGAVLNGVVQEYSVGIPQGLNLGISYDGYTYMRLATTLIEASDAAWSDIHAILPGTTAGVETWHTPVLLNGWTGQLRYRLLASPPGNVEVRGNLVAGTKADGTALANLPSGYLPARGQDLFTNAFGGTLGTSQIPHVNINTAGTLQIFGIGTSTNLNVYDTYSLDYF